MHIAVIMTKAYYITEKGYKEKTAKRRGTWGNVQGKPGTSF